MRNFGENKGGHGILDENKGYVRERNKKKINQGQNL